MLIKIFLTEKSMMTLEEAAEKIDFSTEKDDS